MIWTRSLLHTKRENVSRVLAGEEMEDIAKQMPEGKECGLAPRSPPFRVRASLSYLHFSVYWALPLSLHASSPHSKTHRPSFQDLTWPSCVSCLSKCRGEKTRLHSQCLKTSIVWHPSRCHPSRLFRASRFVSYSNWASEPRPLPPQVSVPPPPVFLEGRGEVPWGNRRDECWKRDALLIRRSLNHRR